MTAQPPYGQPMPPAEGPPGAPAFALPLTPPGGEEGRKFSPRDIIQILRKRMWMIAIFVVFFTCIAIVGTFLWAKWAPMFRATAVLAVRTPMRGNQAFVAADTGISTDMPELLATHAELIVQEDTLNEAAQNEELRKTSWSKRGPKADLVERLKRSLTVSPRAKTRLIYVSMMIGDKNEVAIVANAVAEAYVRISKDSHDQRLLAHIDRLSKQIKEWREALGDIRLDIENQRRGAAVADLGERSSTKTHELDQLKMQFIRYQMQYTQVKTLRDKLAQAQDEGKLLELSELREVLNADPGYRALLTQQSQAVSQLDFYRRSWGPRHSAVHQAEAQLKNVSDQVAEEQRIVVQAYLASREAELGALETHISELNESIHLVETDVRELHLVQARLRQLKSEEADTQNLIATLTRNLAAARFRRDLEAPVDLVAYARVPRERSQPKYAFMVPGGVMLGLLVGLGLTVLLEVIDTSIKKPSDIPRRMDLPLLGMVPHIDDLAEDIPDPRLAMQTFPDSPVGEAFRHIRTRIIFSGPLERQRTLMITSPLPEDGRTTVTANLGIVMSHSGSKVLLVDANFRQPMLHQLFEGASDAGLSNALVAQANWRDLIFEAGENLHILPAGPLPPNPSELLASVQMRDLIEEAVTQYDRILFDSGPCLVVTDPAVLAGQVDGVIMVFRAGVNTHGVAQKARDDMIEANAHILGAILNGVRAMAGGYLRKNYEAFYEYRERQSLPS
ncbi:hypothetical protein LCGC14_0017640 [marine sediment metagenome]|uniref:AAA domain-containing protein n=1 Tax=marine sediment metagenome TaxID=412755 RepID=A0A0F9W4N7_9ZZZZ|nr:polysaccharide biosynthesis tyrosine autokinase [Phycisphaerae bacterium]HDZ44882.1 polysaccharide biosynthesis tyrosine autokinase [Phycisphaerae bacterium]